MMTNRSASRRPRNARASRRRVAARLILEALEQKALLASIVDLGPGEAWNINNSGQVVGTTSGGQAFVYSGGLMTDLGTVPGYMDSDGRGINDSGQVIGSLSGDRYNTEGAFFYSQGTGMIAFGAPQYLDTIPFGINDSGQIVGEMDVSSIDDIHGFLYSDGQLTELGAPPGYMGFIPNAINNSGQIVFTGPSAGGLGSHSFLYTESTGAWTDLGDVNADAINDSGQVVGDFYDAAASESHAFLYSPGKGMIDLGTPPGSLYSLANGEALAYGIDNSAQVVGFASVVYAGYAANNAFLYTAQSGMVTLDSLLPPNSGWDLEGANAINDHGQIVGYGYFDGGEKHAYLLDLNQQPPSQPPHVTDIVSAGQNKKGLIGITVVFDEGLDSTVLNAQTLFSVRGAVTKHHKTVYMKPVRIKGLGFDGQTRVTIKLARPYKGAVEVAVLGSVLAADGASNDIDFSKIVE